MSSERIRVGIIFGGRSGEHEVSLRSARSVIDAIDKDKYEVLPVGITKEGRWIAGNDPWKALTGGNEATMQAALLGEPGDRMIRAIEPAGEALSELRDIAAVDVIFPVLHGPYGEDGTVQGLLELADVPYVGAGVVGSAVGMDKAIFKAVMLTHGLPTLPYLLVLRSDWEQDRDTIITAIETKLTYPVFAKPANLGSSVGVDKALNRAELIAVINDAARYDRRLIVEQGIPAREIEVSVMGNDAPIASVPGEIIPGDKFYSYKDKYINDDAQLIIPAPIDDTLSEQVREMAIEAYKAIDCAGLARCDFLLHREKSELYLNEVNTIPGFTSISMYPKLWEASGISYPDLIDRLIQYALERHREKSRNLTSFEAAE